MDRQDYSQTLFFLILCVAVGLTACGRGANDPQETPTVGETTFVGQETKAIATEVVATDPATATMPATETPRILATETVSPESPVGETPVAKIESLAHAQGMGETLVLPGCYEFDNGVSADQPDPSCDLDILAGPGTGTIEVFPVTG